MLASQRIESVVGGWFSGATQIVQLEAPTKRGATPSAVEWLILAWVSGKLIIVLGFINLYVFIAHRQSNIYQLIYFTQTLYTECVKTFISNIPLCLF